MSSLNSSEMIQTMLEMLLDLAAATSSRLFWQNANVLKMLQFYEYSGCFLFSVGLIFHVAPRDLEH